MNKRNQPVTDNPIEDAFYERAEEAVRTDLKHYKEAYIKHTNELAKLQSSPQPVTDNPTEDAFYERAELDCKKPKIVCLCGSLRFLDEFKIQEVKHLMRGEIALMPCCMFTDIQRDHPKDIDYKKLADARHKRLIDLCDIVLVLNVGGYIGESTRSEIDYANNIGKPVTYLETDLQGTNL